MRCDYSGETSARLPFAALLKTHRRAARLSQEELARRAGVSVRTISGLESGTRHVPYKETVRLLAQALELSAEEYASFAESARRNGPAVASRPGMAGHVAVRDQPRSPLPAPATPLFGRERELELAGALLLRSDVRLLTLCGPPGVGKTRLAMQVATERAESFADGAYVVWLASLRATEYVLPAIAGAIGVRDMGGENLKAAVFGALRERHALLVLDNFEHLLGAAPLVAELLEACARVKALVTSREKLRLRGEQIFPVAPLALPDSHTEAVPRDLERVPSVQLFLDRARRISPAFTLTPDNALAIAAVCRRLDGLPLALELAAARITLLTPEKLLSRLESRLSLLTSGARDLPTRQQTLRDALAWSYGLLGALERAVFRRLSVFAGGASFEAVYAVCQCSRHGDQECRQLATLDVLTSLVDKSMIVCDDTAPHARGDTRISMLETLREYAGELLAASGEVEDSRRAHATYYAEHAEAVERLDWRERNAQFVRCESDLDNFRAALRWAMQSHITQDVELGLRLAGALGIFWYRTGHLGEGLMWLQGLLARSGECARPCAQSVRAKAFHMAGWIAIDQGEYAKANRLLAQSVALYRETREPTALAAALNRWGEAVFRQGDCEGAEAIYSESLGLRRQSGDLFGVAASLNNLAAVATERKRYEDAVTLLSEARGIYTSLGEHSGELFVLNNLGDLARERGDVAGAGARWREALALARRVGDLGATAASLGCLGRAAREQGQYAESAAFWRESLKLQRQVENSYAIAFCVLELANLERDQGRYEAALTLYWESLELYRKMAVTAGTITCLEGLASVAASRQQAERAAELCGAVAALRETMGAPLRPVDSSSYDRAIAQARAALGDEGFVAAWSVGRHLPPGDVYTSALNLATAIWQAR